MHGARGGDGDEEAGRDLRPLGGESGAEEALFEVADGREEEEEEEGADEAAHDRHDGRGGDRRLQDLHRRECQHGEHRGHQEARALVQRHRSPFTFQGSQLSSFQHLNSMSL